MDYLRQYKMLISSRKERILDLNEHVENHHIIPRSLGGSDNETNLIKLTPREHFIAHWLLWRIHRNRPTACAFHFICMNLDKISSRAYEEARNAHNLAISGENNGRYNGKGTTELTRQKIRDKKIGTKASAETRKLFSEQRKGEKNGRYGKPLLDIWVSKYGEDLAKTLYDEWKLKISKQWKGKPKTEEQKNKMSISKIGHIVSEETRQKIRDTKRRNKEMKHIMSRNVLFSD